MYNSEKALKPEKIPFLPEVSLQVADSESEAEHFYEFIKEERGTRWGDLFTELFPALVKKLEGVNDKEEAMRICKEFSEEQHKIHQEEILRMKELFEKEWERIEAEFLSELSKHFETDWAPDKTKIVGNVTVLPVFPRHLDEYSFFVGYKNVSSMIETAAHEIVHFLWFKKWKEVFPESKRREYESPNLAWRLSEIIVQIILQCNPEIKKLINPKNWGYDSFKKIKIGDVSMTEYFKKVYEDSVAEGNDFATTMKLLWNETKKHENEISEF